jgi:hypothetical protein
LFLFCSISHVVDSRVHPHLSSQSLLLGRHHSCARFAVEIQITRANWTPRGMAGAGRPNATLCESIRFVA